MTSKAALQKPSGEEASARGPTADDVRRAAGRIKGRVTRTPLIRAEKLSAATGAEIWLKLEIFQQTGAFKERGAVNKLLSLSEAEKRRGVIAASAGNHGQGVARHAKALGIAATIVMPTTTPDVKVRETRALGAAVVLAGHGFDEARRHAEKIRSEQDLVFIHPFDDADIIAGQGTIALEMLEDRPAYDAVIVPIG